MYEPNRFSSGFRVMALSALLVNLMITGCAAPVSKTIRVYDQPARVPVQVSAGRPGTIARIEVVETEVGVTGAGAASGAVIGGLLTSPLGHAGHHHPGRGAFPFAVVGIVAGALIGNEIEKQQARASTQRHYRVMIDFDDGDTQTYTVLELNGLYTGERVKVERGQIAAAT